MRWAVFFWIAATAGFATSCALGPSGAIQSAFFGPTTSAVVSPYAWWTALDALQCSSTETWTAVTTFSLHSTGHTDGLSIGVDPLSPTNVVMGGKASDSTSASAGYRAFIRASADGGSTWNAVSTPPSSDTLIVDSAFHDIFSLSTGFATVGAVQRASGTSLLDWVGHRVTTTPVLSSLDMFRPTTSESSAAYAGALAPSGRKLYIVGDEFTGTTITRGLVRVADISTSGTIGSLSNLTTYARSTTASTGLRQVFFDSSDAIWLVGFGNDSDWRAAWTVLRSTDGTTWTSLESFPSDSSLSASAFDGGTTSTGSIIVVGSVTQTAGSSVPRWTIRRSTNSGSSWTTVDSYQLYVTKGAVARSFSRGPGGILYVAGYGTDVNDKTHLIVRKSTDDGATWTTALDTQPSGGGNALAYRITVDSAGTVWVAGSAVSSASGLREAWVQKRPCR